MEHRWSKRLKKAIKIMLHHHYLPVAVCKTRDVGTEGLFVECEALGHKNNTVYEIEFDVTSGYECRRHRLTAITVHFLKEGVGLLIRDPESEAAQAWRDMIQSMYSEQPAGESSAVSATVVDGS